MFCCIVAPSYYINVPGITQSLGGPVQYLLPLWPFRVGHCFYELILIERSGGPLSIAVLGVRAVSREKRSRGVCIGVQAYRLQSLRHRLRLDFISTPRYAFRSIAERLPLYRVTVLVRWILLVDYI